MKHLIIYILLILSAIESNCQISSIGDYNNQGKKIGIWEYYNENNDLILKVNYKKYSTGRIGASCYDGWRSYSTGKGTCSHHGGVAKWLYGSTIILDTIFIDNLIQPLNREYSALDKLSSNFTINPDIEFHYEINLLQQTLPNSYIEEDEIIWYPSDGSDYHYTSIKNVANVIEDGSIYKLIFSETKYGKGLNMPISEDVDYEFWGSNKFFTIMVYKFIEDGYIPTDFKLIQRCYPYVPLLEDIQIYKGQSSHILVRSFKWEYGVISKTMDVLKIENDKLTYEIDDYWISLAEEESDTIGYYSDVTFRSSNDSDNLLVVTKYRNGAPNESEAISLISNEDKLQSLDIISNYYSALKSNDFSSLEKIYCSELSKFNKLINHSRAETISEHKRYLSKFKIISFKPLLNSIKENGNQLSFLIEYSITRKTDEKTINFLLEINIEREGNRICSLEENILKRY